jgi:hypothetical protein
MTTARKPASRATRISRWFKSPAGQKLTHTGPALVVFGVAAYQSYWHTVDVSLRAAQDGVTSHIMPLSVDGMMIVAARYITHAQTRLGRVIAGVAFVVGICATVGANLAASGPTMVDHVVSVWPAVSMTFTAAILHWGDRKASRKPARRTTATAAKTTKLRAV